MKSPATKLTVLKTTSYSILVAFLGKEAISQLGKYDLCREYFFLEIVADVAISLPIFTSP